MIRSIIFYVFIFLVTGLGKRKVHTLYLFWCWLLDLIRLSPFPKHAENLWRNRKITCERDTCRHLIKEESYNCVNSCVSRSCYEEIYGKMPLEDGEIDLHREKAFSICVNNEFKRLKKVFAWGILGNYSSHFIFRQQFNKADSVKHL